MAWKPPASACLGLPGFVALDSYPTRSPLLIADYLRPLVEGRHYLELGSRSGDIFACVSASARETTVVEINPSHCAKLRERGARNVRCHPVERLSASTFPKADVIFWWPHNAETTNPAWLSLVSTLVEQQGRTARVVVAFDMSHHADRASLPGVLRTFNGSTTERILFDEDSRGERERMAALEAMDEGRPGRFGVFQLATFWAPMGMHSRRHRPRKPGSVARGICGVTQENTGCPTRTMDEAALSGEGEGEAWLRSHSGSWDAGKHGIGSLEECAAKCEQWCPRCRYVSFSSTQRDCSWFSTYLHCVHTAHRLTGTGRGLRQHHGATASWRRRALGSWHGHHVSHHAPQSLNERPQA